MVDDKKIAFNPAVELSYLKPEEQRNLLEAMDMEQATPSLSQRLKKFSAEVKCTLEAMCDIMREEKKGELDKVTLTSDKQIDTSTLDRELKNYEVKLREVDLNKTRLENEIDSLPEDTRFRERKLHDMTLRLDGRRA